MNRLYTFLIPTHDNEGTPQDDWLREAKSILARKFGGYTLGITTTVGWIMPDGGLVEETCTRLECFIHDDDRRMIDDVASHLARTFQQDSIRVIRDGQQTATFHNGGHDMSIRRRARAYAMGLIEADRNGGPVDAFCEELDSQREIDGFRGNCPLYGDLIFAHLAVSTLRGAVRAAARKLDRYDAENDEVLPRG